MIAITGEGTFRVEMQPDDSLLIVGPVERRTAFDPATKCDYCGDRRDGHDRLTREWEQCHRKAAFFAIPVQMPEETP